MEGRRRCERSAPGVLEHFPRDQASVVAFVVLVENVVFDAVINYCRIGCH